MSTYVKLNSNGNYEYGFVSQNLENRRKDKMVKQGEAASYKEACAAIGIRP